MCDTPRVVRVNRKNLSKMVYDAQVGLPSSAVQYYEVPCGKCASCLRARQDDWAVRIESEVSSWIAGNIYFIRLSYNPESVPLVPVDSSSDSPLCMTLRKKDLQNFFKRLRMYWSDEKFRYFACGEYGGLGRPHYHVILFSSLHLSPIELKYELENHIWAINHSRRSAFPDYRSLGFCNVKMFERRNARYCAKYTTKDLAADYYDVQERPFRSCFQASSSWLRLCPFKPFPVTFII